MEPIKGALQSKAVMGAVVSLLSMGIATLTGYVIPPEQQGALAGNLLDLTAAAGAVVSIYGSVVRQHRIAGLIQPKAAQE